MFKQSINVTKNNLVLINFLERVLNFLIKLNHKLIISTTSPSELMALSFTMYLSNIEYIRKLAYLNLISIPPNSGVQSNNSRLGEEIILLIEMRRFVMF